jgi:hypothetical protein
LDIRSRPPPLFPFFVLAVRAPTDGLASGLYLGNRLGLAPDLGDPERRILDLCRREII